MDQTQYQKALNVLREYLGEELVDDTIRSIQELSPEFEEFIVSFVMGEVYSRGDYPSRRPNFKGIKEALVLLYQKGL